MEVLQTSPVCFVGSTSMRLSYVEHCLDLAYLESEIFGCTRHGSGFLRDTPWTVASGGLPSNLLESWRVESLGKNDSQQEQAYSAAYVAPIRYHYLPHPSLSHLALASRHVYKSLLFLAAGMYMPTL
jgi:hypothetical protein